VRIYVERLESPPTLIEDLLKARAGGEAAALVTLLVNGGQALVDSSGQRGNLIFTSRNLANIQEFIAGDRSGIFDLTGTEFFVEVWTPPTRLILVGAVHIAQAVVPAARLLGWQTVIIDPRGAFGTQERFPDIELLHDWPDEALPRLKPDKRTAIVTLTHDPKIDDPALQAALASTAFYIGALGSRKTHEARCRRLAEAGFDADRIARVHGPVGLAIGAVTPAEIAVSILGEIIAARRGAPVRPRA
jgi:xanthine dehydrogenase accessory factor